MTQGTALVVVPNDLQLPAHLRTAEAAAAIAAANAAAAGGIRSGGFPRISKDGSKFHIIDGDEDIVLMNPSAGPGLPATPMMAIQVAVVAGNPALSKVYFKDKKAEGVSVAPTCSSSNGIVPDAHITAPQSPSCANCQWNVWGSKISDYSGKKIKACGEHKQIAVFPVSNGVVDTTKPFGLAFTVSELAEWGQYVSALDSKGASVTAVITNLSFDLQVSHPKIICSFGGFLALEQWTAVTARVMDADVRAIVASAGRTAVPTGVPALPAPLPVTVPVIPIVPVQAPAPQAPVPAVAAGFGAAPPPAAVATLASAQVPPVVVVPAAAAPQPEKPKRAPRKPPEPLLADARIMHLPSEQQTIVMATGGPDGAVGKALLAQYPAAPVQEAVVNSEAATPSGHEQPAAAAVTSTALAAPASAPAAAGFGAATTGPVATTAVVTGVAADLQARLMAKLGGKAA